MDTGNDIIFRVEKTKDFTVMSNHHLKDTSLTLKENGLLSMILSLPETWDYSISGLVAICKEGENALRNTIKELEKRAISDAFKSEIKREKWGV